MADRPLTPYRVHAMNRALSPSPDLVAKAADAFDRECLIGVDLCPTHEPVDDHEIGLFAPVSYEDGYAYPLVVWLHDEQGSEADLPRVMPHISLRNHVGVAPRGSQVLDSGYGWSQTVDGIAEAVERVDESIAAAKQRFNIHDERVFVAGYGTGGTMALRMALELPDRFAGVAVMDCDAPRGCRPLRNLNLTRSLPLMMATSDSDDPSRAARAAEDLKMLYFAGLSLDIRLYPAGDSLTTKMLSDIDGWILQQVCPATAC